MTSLTRLAPAKVNLSLRVIGRRADGYHLLDSLVVFTDFGDQLRIGNVADDHKPRMTICGDFAEGLTVDDNLVLRAIDQLAQATSLDFANLSVELEKQIPVAAGLGGGSADAAAALTAIANISGNIDPGIVLEIARSLGADVPMCLNSGPKFVSGIGHDLHAISYFPPADLILVNPGIELSTADIFGDLNIAMGDTSGSFTGDMPTHEMPFSDLSELVAFVKHAGNDLTEPAMKRVPEIAHILKALETAGALHAQMSGSGATCYGLCEPGRGPEIMQALDLPLAWWRVSTAILQTPFLQS